MGFPFLLPAPRLAKCTMREYRIPVSSFRAKARNLFRLRSGKEVRMTDKGKHRTLCDVGTRCFMQTALRRKTETGNEKDPSAALGMTKRGKATSHFFSVRYGSQPPALRANSFQRKEVEEVKTHLPPSCGRGMPEGQGVGRRRKCTCQQKLDTKLKKLGIKIEYLYKIQ